MNIEVLYFEGCPNHLPAIEMVRETLKSLGREDEIRQIEVRTQADAEAVAFVGHPASALMVPTLSRGRVRRKLSD
jgi:hypothetical protein